MPRTFSGILSFVVVATVTVIVGTFVYNRAVAPLLAQFKKAA